MSPELNELLNKNSFIWNFDPEKSDMFSLGITFIKVIF